MDITTLKAFVVISENGSFSEAAEQLFLTQSAISKRIQTLELELNTSLFDRRGRTIRLTEAGDAFLSRAQKILYEYADGRRAIENLSESISGQLRVGTSHHIGLHRLPPVLREFIKRYPEVKLDLKFMDSEDVCSQIDKGELEIGVITLPNINMDNLELQSIWDDPLSIVVGKEHPLFTQAKVTPAELNKQAVILPAPNTYTRQMVDHHFSTLGIDPIEIISVNYLETIKMLVSVGMGWSVLPYSLVGLDSSNLKNIPINGFNMQRSLGVCWNRHYTLSNAARALLQLLQDVVHRNNG